MSDVEQAMIVIDAAGLLLLAMLFYRLERNIKYRKWLRSNKRWWL